MALAWAPGPSCPWWGAATIAGLKLQNLIDVCLIFPQEDYFLLERTPRRGVEATGMQAGFMSSCMSSYVYALTLAASLQD